MWGEGEGEDEGDSTAAIMNAFTDDRWDGFRMISMLDRSFLCSRSCTVIKRE